jgi:hypothetical protein
MGAYFAANWLAILSLIVALVGGVPGIVTIINHWRDVPRFSFSLAQWISGESISDDRTVPFIFLTGTASNPGKQPLLPACYELRLQVRTNEYQLERTLIPEDISFGSERQIIQVDKPWARDLQRRPDSIVPGLPVLGFLMFLAPHSYAR